MRTFERTHPWLRFQLDLRPAPPELWLRLGEAQSKCEHIAGVPLRPDTALRLHQVFLAKGALATTAIEGNTLSESEVLQLLEGKLQLPKSREYLGQEVENIVRACNQITDKLGEADGRLSAELLRSFNRAVLEGLELPADTAPPGETRTYPVVVGRYRGAPHEDCDHLLTRMCEWLNEPSLRPQNETKIAFAILRAALAHLYIAWIHPFGDGNGRTARLVEFFILLTAGVPSPAAHLLSNHYNQTRSEYYRQLQAASESGGDVLLFVSYAVQGFVDGLREQLAQIRTQQWDVAWRNFVDEAFRDQKTGAPTRQRDLVLDLSAEADWVAVSDIPTLTPRLARAYAGKGTKTVSRDLNALVSRELLDKKGPKVRARRETILAFLPPRKTT
jgi:Fic family protein